MLGKLRDDQIQSEQRQRQINPVNEKTHLATTPCLVAKSGTSELENSISLSSILLIIPSSPPNITSSSSFISISAILTPSTPSSTQAQFTCTVHDYTAPPLLATSLPTSRLLSLYVYHALLLSPSSPPSQSTGWTSKVISLTPSSMLKI